MILPGRIILKVLPPVINTVLFIALYSASFSIMLKSWAAENYTYCYLIPPVVAFLVWDKLRELARTHTEPGWFGLPVIVLALVLYWLGELGGEYYTLYISSWLMVVGFCLLHLGWRKLKVLSFPLCFSLAMFPLPNVVFNTGSLKLKLLSSRLGVWLLQSVGMGSYREGNIIDLGFTKLQVVDACSGLRYLIPLVILAVLLAHYFPAPFWQKCLLVLSAIPVTVFCNSLRIASVAFLYQFWGAQVAEGFFHDFSGWLIFMVSLALLLGEIWLFRRLSPREARHDKSTAPAPPTRPTEAPAAASRQRFLPASVVTVMLATSLVYSHSLKMQENVPIARPLIQFPLDLGEWRGTRSTLEGRYLDHLKLSDYLLTDYRNGIGETISMYVAYHDSQRKGASTHSPASCLPGSGWVFEESGEVRLPGNLGGGVEVNRALIEKTGERMLVYYWFPQRGRTLTSMAQLKLYLFWDALTKRRTDGAMVRIITPVYPSEEADMAEARLSSFTRQVLPLLPQFIPN